MNSVSNCIEACNECSIVCRQTIIHCLNVGDEYSEPEQIRPLMDCADICRVSTDLMLRGSKNIKYAL